ncbi:hypothetical protein FJTKL_01812 [Diaporthe vaccinii]|uniref:Uncharacterized protein n=1 Tax=Diaporthe vaccinii TaxID=105482 RepID=A0ABR4F4C2_9PEZI
MQVKAAFWNFVVNDLEESFVSHRRTRTDTGNLALWCNMGLLVEDDGSLTTGASPNSLTNTAEHARDKALSYTLIRYLCKLINYLAPSSHLETMLVQRDRLSGPSKSSFRRGSRPSPHPSSGTVPSSRTAMPAPVSLVSLVENSGSATTCAPRR